ncbi:unnamed protein product [Alopecurus aequalis]
MEFISEEIVREILLKLPTRDAVRCLCVSKQWRSLLSDPAFVDLHARTAHAVPGHAEALLLLQRRPAGMTLETTLCSVSSAKPLCRVTDLREGYRPMNVCNGFLLLAKRVGDDDPLFVCNPITGEKLKIPAPPMIATTHCHTYAMGFSHSTATGQYKLFRFSTRETTPWHDTWKSYLEVYIVGSGGGWHRHPHMFPHRVMYGPLMPPPTILEDKLYMVTEKPQTGGTPEGMLVIDVASETHHTYPLPKEFTARDRAAAHTFEMSGRLCLAMRVLGRPMLHFWVMPPLDGMEDTMLHRSWELRYTFYVDDNDNNKHDYRQSSAWLDARGRMLCYRLGDTLYKYDITKDEERVQMKKGSDDISQWDRQIQLPSTPPSSYDHWSVYGGYRPSLLSPQHLVCASNDNEQKHFGNTLLHALR